MEASSRSPSFVRVKGTGEIIGAVQLCRSGSDYWGYIVLYEPELFGFWSQAGLYRFHNGQKVQHWNCDSAPLGPPRGGNGHVEPSQTQCWTQKIHNTDPADKFYVLGIECIGTYPTCEDIVSRGETAVTR